MTAFRTPLSRKTLAQFLDTGDEFHLEDADADTLRDMVRLLVDQREDSSSELRETVEFGSLTFDMTYHPGVQDKPSVTFAVDSLVAETDDSADLFDLGQWLISASLWLAGAQGEASAARIRTLARQAREVKLEERVQTRQTKPPPAPDF